MSRGNKLRIFVCLMVIAFVVSIEYKTIYQVVVASPLVQMIVGDSVSDNTVQEEENSSEGTETEELPDGETVEVTIEDETEEETEDETEGNVNEGTSFVFDEQDAEIPFGNEEENDTQSNGSSDESVSNEETGIFSVNPEESLSENTIAEELENVSAPYGESAIPTTLDAFITYYDSLDPRKVPITTKQDWLNLQELSQVTSLEGYVFDIQDNNTTGDTNTKLYDLQNMGFTGIGCETYPFKGTLTCYLENGMSVKTSVPIFAYLAGGSTVKNFSIIGVDSIAGVAGVLTGSGDVSAKRLSNSSIFTTAFSKTSGFQSLSSAIAPKIASNKSAFALKGNAVSALPTTKYSAISHPSTICSRFSLQTSSCLIVVKRFSRILKENSPA